MPRKPKLGPIEADLSIEEINRYLSESRFLIHLKEEFDEERNPLAAWEALLVATRTDRPIPDWVLHYLAKSAERLFTFRNGKPPGKGEMPAHVTEALGMGSAGKGNRFSRYFASQEREAVTKAVIFEREKNPQGTLQGIYSKVAGDFRLSNATVENWFKAHKKRFLPRIVKPR